MKQALIALEEAHRMVIRTGGFKWILLLSGAMVFVFAGMVGLAGWAGTTVAKMATEWLESTVSCWILKATAFIIKVGTLLLLLYVLMTTYKLLVLSVFAPFCAWFSEKVEEQYTGNVYPFRLNHFIVDVGRGVMLAFRNAVIETLWGLVVGLAGFFSAGVGWTLGIWLLLVQSYFWGFSFCDYALERRRLTVRERVQWARTHKSSLATLGLFCMVLMLVPVVGWAAGMVYGSSGGTLLVVREFEKESSLAR